MTIIDEMLKKKRKLHFSLIDPVSQDPEKAGAMAELCELSGSDAIMVGGSTVQDREIVQQTVVKIKIHCDLPVIAFPNSAQSISTNFDHIFFMELLNSEDLRFRGGEQIRAAPFIRKAGLKTISMGYIVVSTSSRPTTVEKAVKLDKIGPDDIAKALSYALYAEMIGMSCVYFEAGSGAERPVPDEMIRAVRQAVAIPLIVGGGIRSAQVAAQKASAGADVIVTGTILEQDGRALKEIVSAIGSAK